MNAGELIHRFRHKLIYHIYINKGLEPKEFYKKYRPTNIKTELKQIFINSLNASDSVFEFGCHNGFNLEWIQKTHPNAVTLGLDLNEESINEGRKQGRNYIFKGDEFHLKYFGGFDVAFTCSVLCHNKNNIDLTINELKRIADRVVLIETNAIIGKYYFSHDYEKHGFKKLHSAKNKSFGGNNAIYDYWEWKQ